MRSKTLYWLPLILVIAASAACLAAWAFVVPIFESPDEPHHWRNAQYIHSHFALPPYNESYLEAPQAPLYYILISPLASSSPQPPILRNAEDEKNLGFSFGMMPNIQVDVPCPPHFFANCPADLNRYWPIRRARLATAVLSLVAVLFTALTVLEVTESISSAVIAAALIGFLPQFDFRGATVNNDAALVCFAALATYFIVRMVMRGFELIPALCGSVVIALAFLSKINAAVLVPVFAASICLTSYDWRTRIKRLGVLVLSGAIIAPWVLRNKAVYGDFLGSSRMPQVGSAWVVKRPITDIYFRTTFLQLTSRSFFGYFGWMSLRLPGLIYKGYAVLFLIALIGLGFLVWKGGKHLRIVALLASIALLSLGFVVYANLTYPQAQGRLLFPALSAVMVLAALGLSAALRLRKYVAIAVVFGCLSVNVYALTRVVYPTYWGSKPVQTLFDLQIPDPLMKPAVSQALANGESYVQSFTAVHNGLAAVEVEVTSPEKPTKGSLCLSISTSNGGAPFASVDLQAATISTSPMYAHLNFPPISDSAGKQYFISLSSTGLAPSESLAVLRSESDIYSAGKLFIDGRATGQDAAFRTLYSRPCWTCP